MRFLVISAFVLLVSIFPAVAQEKRYERQYKDDALDASIKCDLAKFAVYLNSLSKSETKEFLQPWKALVTIVETTEIKKKIGGGLDFPFFVFGKAGYEIVSKESNTVSGSRNIHSDNRINCHKSFIINLGIFSCLRSHKPSLLSGVTISCKKDDVATSNASGGGKFLLWTVGADLEGELASIKTLSIEVSAPPPKKQ